MTSCHLSHYIIELNLFVSSFSLRSFFSVFKAESFFSWPNSICLSNILKHVRACTLYYHTFFSPEQLSVMYGHMMSHSRAVRSPAFHPWELISPGEWSWPRCKCRWACGQCQQKIKTFAPSGSNMRAYFSTYSCFSFWCFFVGSKYIWKVFCFSSICCQSPGGCSSSEVTLTLTKKAVFC